MMSAKGSPVSRFLSSVVADSAVVSIGETQSNPRQVSRWPSMKFKCAAIGMPRIPAPKALST